MQSGDDDLFDLDQLVYVDTEAVLNANDFKSARVEISLLNSKTKLQLRNGYKSTVDKKGNISIEENESIVVQFNEILDTGLMLEAPSEVADLGHTLMLKVELKMGDQLLQSMNLSAVVKKMGLRKEGNDVLEIELTQFDPVEWKAFCDYFSNRQTEIEALFEAMKN